MAVQVSNVETELTGPPPLDTEPDKIVTVDKVAGEPVTMVEPNSVAPANVVQSEDEVPPAHEEMAVAEQAVPEQAEEVEVKSGDEEAVPEQAEEVEVKSGDEENLLDKMLKLRQKLATQAAQPKKIIMKMGKAKVTVVYSGSTPSQEDVQNAITKYRASPQFENLINKEKGSPMRVRLAVGSAQTPEDKLATLRRFYPDAVAYKGDNFVYSDPDGNFILHNPEGIDVGDVAGSAREITQVVGSALGAKAGAVSSLTTGPAAVVTAPTMAVIGAGYGNAVAGSLFDAMANFFGLTVDTRSLSEKTLSTTTELAMGSLGQKAGDVIGPAIQKGLGGGKTAAQEMYRRFQKLGIDPPAGASTGSRTIGSIEQSLGSTPASTNIMQDAAEKVMAQTKAAVDKTISRFGDPKTVQGAGQVIREATVKAAERFGSAKERIYDEVWDLVGARTPVALNAISALRETLENQLAEAPRTLGPTLKPVIRQLKNLQKDANETGGLIFERLRQTRTDIGKNLENPVLSGGTSAQNQYQKLIYGALTEDMSAAAAQVGPKAARKLKSADKFVKEWMENNHKLLEKINKFDADERALGFAMQAAKDGGTALQKLRENFLPEEWDTVAATVLHRMGLATPGAQDATGEVVSVSTFMTSWSKLAPEAKKALFGGSRYEEAYKGLETLVEAVSSLKGIEKLTNSSNTGRNIIAFTTISTLAGGLGALGTGDTSGAAGAVVTTILAPRAAAKLITNPRFIKWLTTPITQPAKYAPHITRLAAIAEAEPEIKQEIRQYLDALRNSPIPNAASGVAQ